MQVLQHEHEHRVRRQRVERLAHLPEHPLARRAEHLAAEELAIGRRDDRWHLHQPHRRLRAQHVSDLRIVEAQLPNRVQDGQVRLAHPVLLQTLPVADPHRAVGRDALHEGFDQRRFADAGLSGHEHDLAVAATRLVQPRVHLRERVLPPDETDGRALRRPAMTCLHPD